MILLILLIWLGTVAVTGHLADAKGLTGATGFRRFTRKGRWGLYAVFLPPVALAHALLAKPNKRALTIRAALDG